MEDEHDQAWIGPALPVLADRDQLGQTVHLHRAVADHRDHDAVRMRELGPDRIGHARSHRRQVPRERRHHPLADLDVAGEPVRRRARVGAQDRVVGQPLGKLEEQPLWVDRIGALERALLHQLPPLPDLMLDLLAPGTVVLSLQQRDQCPKSRLRVTDELDLHRVADPDHPPVNVDLHAASLPLLGQELRVGEARADHQERVAVHHQVPARLRAQQTDRSGHERKIVGQHRLAEQRFRDARAQELRSLEHLVRSVERARPTSIATRLPAFRCRGARLTSAGTTIGGAYPTDEWIVPWARGGVSTAASGDVVGNDHARHRALVAGDPHSTVDEMAHLLRRGRHLHELMGDVLEQRHQVDLLLVGAAERGRGC